MRHVRLSSLRDRRVAVRGLVRGRSEPPDRHLHPRRPGNDLATGAWPRSRSRPAGCGSGTRPSEPRLRPGSQRSAVRKATLISMGHRKNRKRDRRQDQPSRTAAVSHRYGRRFIAPNGLRYWRSAGLRGGVFGARGESRRPAVSCLQFVEDHDSARYCLHIASGILNPFTDTPPVSTSSGRGR